VELTTHQGKRIVKTCISPQRGEKDRNEQSEKGKKTLPRADTGKPRKWEKSRDPFLSLNFKREKWKCTHFSSRPRYKKKGKHGEKGPEALRGNRAGGALTKMGCRSAGGRIVRHLKDTGRSRAMGGAGCDETQELRSLERNVPFRPGGYGRTGWNEKGACKVKTSCDHSEKATFVRRQGCAPPQGSGGKVREGNWPYSP